MAGELVDRKRCTRCKRWGNVPGDFYLQKRKLRDGTVRHYPKAHCIPCEKKRVAKWKDSNPDKVKAHGVNRRVRDPEGLREYQRQWWRQHHGKGKQYRVGVVELGPERRLDSRPLTLWMKEFFAAPQWKNQLAKVARDADVSDTVFMRLYHGRQPLVHLTTVDKIGHSVGEPGLLVELYPEEE